jgi:hypothetical protein
LAFLCTYFFWLKRFLKILKWVFAPIGLVLLVIALWFLSVYFYENYHLKQFEKKEIFANCQENGGMVNSDVVLYKDSTFYSITYGWPFGETIVWGSYEINGNTLRFTQDYNEQSFLDCEFVINEQAHELAAKRCDAMTFYRPN